MENDKKVVTIKMDSSMVKPSNVETDLDKIYSGEKGLFLSGCENFDDNKGEMHPGRFVLIQTGSV